MMMMAVWCGAVVAAVTYALDIFKKKYFQKTMFFFLPFRMGQKRRGRAMAKKERKIFTR